MLNLNEKNLAQYIYDGEDLGHPYIQRTTVLCDNIRTPRHTVWACVGFICEFKEQESLLHVFSDVV